eukprot:CAMPEP_0117745242 /NCGR_PEP_ID=MMETSP0947-20121206/7238_1 /TAXON_ID=44440 /ORGANISM="Chattonella subsalsa, Strain CCMP2191" /LENGTH=241 /DNA_ID=CAMNT_0005562345 /DNA_START=450 /DNA_END=1175 /DNA_ORIENTATION=-
MGIFMIYMLVGILASVKLWLLLHKTPRDTYGIWKELKIFSFVQVILYSATFVWMMIRQIFNLPQIPLGAYLIIVGNCLIFYSSFAQPFIQTRCAVAPSFDAFRAEGGPISPFSSVREHSFLFSALNIERVLDDEREYDDLLEICQSHFFGELPRFLQEVHHYKKIPSNEVKKQFKKYTKIVEDFIGGSAPFEINISSSMMKDVLSLQRFECFCTADESSRLKIFDACFNEVLGLLGSNFTN